MVPVPQFHRPAIAACNGEVDGLLICFSGELLDLVDVPAEPVEEI